MDVPAKEKARRVMADKILDAKGLNCPLPILKAKKAINDVTPGGTLEILATDPGSVADFQAFCRQTGHELVEHNESGGVYRFLIKRAA
jgi:tRNA 2-thiouridine synthesizing protein A